MAINDRGEFVRERTVEEEARSHATPPAPAPPSLQQFPPLRAPTLSAGSSGRGFAFVAIASLLIIGGLIYWHQGIGTANHALPEQQIGQALNAYQNAVMNRNAEAAGNCYAPIVQGYFLANSVPRSEVIADYQRKFRKYPEIVRFAISGIRVISSSNTRTTVTFEKSWDFRGPKPYAGDEKAQMVFLKIDGEWKILADCDVELNWTWPATDLRNQTVCLAVGSSI
jgi:hypothetical protein